MRRPLLHPQFLAAGPQSVAAWLAACSALSRWVYEAETSASLWAACCTHSSESGPLSDLWLPWQGLNQTHNHVRSTTLLPTARVRRPGGTRRWVLLFDPIPRAVCALPAPRCVPLPCLPGSVTRLCACASLYPSLLRPKNSPAQQWSGSCPLPAGCFVPIYSHRGGGEVPTDSQSM